MITQRHFLPVRLLHVCALLLAGGCYQIETLVKLHEDGSATITERYQISRRMLEFEQPGGGSLLAAELTREAVMERMKRMGEGITLESYQQRDGEAGSRESLCTFRIPDASAFQYASPYLALPGYGGRCLMKCAIVPVYQSSSYLRTGVLGIRFTPQDLDAAQPRAPQGKADTQPPPREPSPAELQIYRQLQPVIRDMLQGIKLKFTVECYAPVMVPQYTPLRNKMSGTYRCDFIDFSDRDLDANSSRFLDNEEIVLELAQMNFNGPNIRRHLQGYGDNLTLPLFHADAPALYHMPPSKFYFDKFFAGKNIGYYNDPKTQKPAVFEEIGFKRKPDPPSAPQAP